MEQKTNTVSASGSQDDAGPRQRLKPVSGDDSDADPGHPTAKDDDVIENDSKGEILKAQQNKILSSVLESTIQEHYSFIEFDKQQDLLNCFWDHLYIYKKRKKNQKEERILEKVFNGESDPTSTEYLKEKAKQFFRDYILITELQKAPINRLIYKKFESGAKKTLKAYLHRNHIVDKAINDVVKLDDFYTEVFNYLIADEKIHNFKFFEADFFCWIYISPARVVANKLYMEHTIYNEQSGISIHNCDSDELINDGHSGKHCHNCDPDELINDRRAMVPIHNCDPDELSGCTNNTDESDAANALMKLIEAMAGPKDYEKLKMWQSLGSKAYGEIAYELGISIRSAKRRVIEAKDLITNLIKELRQKGILYCYF